MDITAGFLFLDLYELTIAQLYFRQGLHETRARFEHFFRSYPDYGTHKAGYCIAAGLEPFIEWMSSVRVTATDLSYLKEDGRFDSDFLDWLSEVGGFAGLDLWAIPEGRVVHPQVPMTVVEGPLGVAQMLETGLLNQLNFPTLIATKASRVVEAAHGGAVMEFGMRRAAAFGATSASRASIVGGAAGTSHAGLSYRYGMEPRGTHAHSMVQVFMALGEGELGAFRAYADVYPDDCLLLVDTIDTLESGIPNAITVFEELRQKGHEPSGIRLDSGDLAYLAIQAAALLNKAGFAEAKIVLSGELDELNILSILNQIADESPRYGVDADHLIGRLSYGVGTRMSTSHGDPSLDGVYKLVAISGDDGWRPAIKVSDSPAKVINPGSKRAFRIYDERRRATADFISLAEEGEPEPPLTLQHPQHSATRRYLPATRISSMEELHVPVLREGSLVHELSGLEAARERRNRDVELLDPGVRRLVNPHIYHVSISSRLWELKQELIAEFNQ